MNPSRNYRIVAILLDCKMDIRTICFFIMQEDRRYRERSGPERIKFAGARTGRCSYFAERGSVTRPMNKQVPLETCWIA